MEKQELEEIIKNGESVWYVLDNGAGIIEAHWGEREFDIFDGDYVVYYDKYCYRAKAKITNLFKTKAEAEHYLHHANVERVEKLPFLTWEEFNEKGGFDFIGKNLNDYGIIINTYNNKISIYENDEIIKNYDLTEDNFYKAYDECVRLFRGEE